MYDGADDRHARPARAERAPAAGPVRLILVALLVLLVIAGVRAGPSLEWSSSWRGPWRDRGGLIGAALELVLASLLVALWVRRRRSPQPGTVAGKLRFALARLIFIAMIAAAIPFVPNLPQGKPKHQPQPASPRKALPPKLPKLRPQTGSGSATEAAVLKYLLIFLAVLALVTACLVLLRKLRLSNEDTELAAEDEDEGSALREAVEAGRMALGELTEPRMAIINCYLAMERSLSLAGAARVAAETPDELLARSTAAGLLHGDAPAELTSLFYEARFSTHPVPQSARDRALHALDVISADLQAAIDRAQPSPAGSAGAP